MASATGVGADAVLVDIVARERAWVYGTATIPAGGEHDGPDVFLFLAHNATDGWIAALRYTPAFSELLAQTPASFPTPEIRATLDGFTIAGDGSADLGFPWAVGQAWRFNGPHANGGSSLWNALDFYPSSAAANAPVTAMRGGVVYRPCANMVMIDHGDGWSSYYYHLTNISVSQGQTVSRGQQIGGTSDQAACGGWASGPHVHVYLKYENRDVAIEGVDIGGWTVERGSQQYQGCLSRGEERHCTQWFSSVMNDGATGSAGGGDGGGDTTGPVSASVSPNRNTVNNWVSYTLAGFPANTAVAITWKRLTGSTIDMGTAQTDATGAATGQFRVPATPGGPNQQITFTAGTVSKTVLFEVAPRIKVNTNPGVRGQVVDVSLRGYARQESFRIRWRKPDGSWVDVASGTTSNTGSANIDVTVPLWAEDGNNSVRGDGSVFRQQTNAVYVEGGAFRPASEEMAPAAATTAPEPAETPMVIDRAALPLDVPLAIVSATDDTGAQPITTVSDADPATAWQADPARGAATLTVDLGRPATLSTVAWLQMESGCGTLERVEASLDGLTWVALNQSSPVTPGEPGTWQTLDAAGDAQFLRWVMTTAPEQERLGCLAEVAIWGTPVATPETTETAPEAAVETPPADATEPAAPAEPTTPEPPPTEAPAEVPATTQPVETPAETAPAPEATETSVEG